MCGFTTEYLDLTYYHYTVRCCKTYENVFLYTCHALLLLLLCSALLYCCCCSRCCLLLLFVIVFRKATFFAVINCILLHLIPVLPFPSFKHDLCSMYPLAVLLSHLQRRFFTYNTYVSHILGACAEPRRALALRGGAP